MKKSMLLFFLLFLIFNLIKAQTPGVFKYQAIARDKDGHILPNWKISLRISIVENDDQGLINIRESILVEQI